MSLPEYISDSAEIKAPDNFDLGEYYLTAEASNKEGTGYLRLVSKNGKDDVILTQDMLSIFNQKHGAMLSTVQNEINTQQRKHLDPSILYPELFIKEVYQDSKGVEARRAGISGGVKDVVYLREHNLNVEGTPMIYFVQDGATSRYASQKDKTVSAHWRLILTGAHSSVLSTANWNDAKGINNIIESMKNPEGLLTVLSLKDEAAAATLTSRRVAFNIKTTFGKLPKMQIPEVKRLIEANGLQTTPGSYGYYQGNILNRSIKINDAVIPFALQIKIPKSSLSDLPVPERKDFPDLSNSEFNQLLHTAEKKNMENWGLKLATLLPSLKGETWRVATFPPQTRIGSDTIFITNFPLEHWNSIAVAASEIASRSYERGLRRVKF